LPAGPPVPSNAVTAVPPAQPFHFNHQIHAGKYEISCQACHVYADTSNIAGIPTGEKCMGCHKFISRDQPDIKALAEAVEAQRPIAWNRVHRLPDHVVFNHGAHVRAGVTCATCHGAVAQMAVVRQVAPLTMGWCVQCHRDHHAPVDNCMVCHK
jgi:hypothetical protein